METLLLLWVSLLVWDVKEQNEQSDGWSTHWQASNHRTEVEVVCTTPLPFVLPRLRGHVWTASLTLLEIDGGYDKNITCQPTHHSLQTLFRRGGRCCSNRSTQPAFYC